MNKIPTMLFAFLFVMLLSQCTQGGDETPAMAQKLDETLARAQKEGKTVMLELGSVGCIPCEQMKPVMQKLRETYKDRLEVIFIDVRQNNKTARRFGVHMIPTQVFLDKDGKEFHRHVGFYSFEEISPILKEKGL